MGAVYVVIFYYESPMFNDINMPKVEETYGIYSLIERAKEAAVGHEQEENNNVMYQGYTITEWMLNVDNGSVGDV